MPRPVRAAYKIPWGAQFGAMRAGGKRKHDGTDYHVPIGTPIFGTENGGRVTGRYFDAGGYGFYVTVTYPSGRTLDAHMREHSPLPVGSPVGVNTIIGYVGLTGNAITADPPGSHDHHERWTNAGVRIDPDARYRLEPASGNFTPIEIEDDMQADERNALMSVYAALFAGGGDAGPKSIISRLNDIEAIVKGTAPKVDNLNKQVTGADGFDPSVAGRVIRVEAQVAATLAAVKALAVGQGLDPNALADLITARVDAALSGDIANIPAAVRAAIIKE